MAWTEAELAKLPCKGGFRMRGESMTRLEVFSDAAFAFALTMLVVSVGSIPSNLVELKLTMKGAPAFALSFAQIAFFWISHRAWSRKYGLEDLMATVLTLVMIFVVLVYVYPLRLIFSSLMAWISGSWFPSEFQVTRPEETTYLFAVYGFGYAAMTGVLALLSLRALKAAGELKLNAWELACTKRDAALWFAHMAVGLGSSLFAMLMPLPFGLFAGFVYFLLAVLHPIIYVRFTRGIDRGG